MTLPVDYHSGWFTFEAAVEWAKKEVASGRYKNPRIMKNLTGPNAGRFTAMVDDIDAHPLGGGWIDHSKGPNVLGDEAAFTLERKIPSLEEILEAMLAVQNALKAQEARSKTIVTPPEPKEGDQDEQDA